MWKSSLQKRKACGMGSCWKHSTLKSIRIIAFMDLVDAIIFTVYRAIFLTHLLARIPSSYKTETGGLTGTAIRTSRGNLAELVTKRVSIDDSINGSGSSHFHHHPEESGTETVVVGDDENHSLGTTYMRYWSVALLTGIVISFAVEVFLFLLLNSGAPMRNLRHCKHWFCLRVLLLIFSIGGMVIELTLGEYNLLSGLLELEKLYRIVTLFVMWKFMDEVKAGYFDNRKLNCNIGATDAGGSSNVFGSNSQVP